MRYEVKRNFGTTAEKYPWQIVDTTAKPNPRQVALAIRASTAEQWCSDLNDIGFIVEV
jgi:hypothetical protein